MADLCTVADVKAFLGLADVNTARDALLATLASAASVAIATEVGGGLLADDVTDDVTGGPGTTLLLRHRPVQCVYAVTIDGVRVPEARSAASGWRLDAAIGQLQLLGRTWASAPLGVHVEYRAGFEDVPVDLKQVAIEEAATAFRERDRLGVQSKTLAGETVTYRDQAFSARSRRVLEQYKLRVPV